MKRLISVLVAGVFAAAVGFAQMGGNQREVAQVSLYKTEPILLSQLRLEAQKLAWPQLIQMTGRLPTTEEINNAIQTMTKERKLQVLNTIINNRLVMQAAEHERITVTDNEINSQMETFRSNVGQTIGRRPTDAEFAEAVREQTGQTIPVFREDIKTQMVLQKYFETKYASQLKSLTVTDEEIRNFYALQKSQLIRPDTVRVSRIYVPFTDAASKARAKELADRLFREIGSNPAKFDEAAAKGSALNSGYKAGDAGYLPRTPQGLQRVGAEFLNTAFTLKQGEVSKLIEHVDGYNIIKITETYEQKNLELDDIVQLGETLTVREYFRMGLLQEKQREIRDQMVVELRKDKGNPPVPPYKILDNNLTW
jgi:parvulin-like peptidyl-prolyl isomerase